MSELYISGVLPVGFSDHSAIFGVRKLHRVKRPPPKVIDVRNYKNYDSKLFREDLNHVPWDFIEMQEDPEEAWNSFRDMFMAVADNHVPVVTRCVRGKSLPWITLHIKNLMKQRDYHKKMAIKTNEEHYWSTYRRLRNLITMKLRKEKAARYVTQLSGKQQPKEIWKTINEITCRSKPYVGVTNTYGLTATMFNDHFSSIAKTCSVFSSRTVFPKILVPRVGYDFVLQNVSVDFVSNELKELKTKATGPDGITSRMLKDGGLTIAKPIAFIINLSFQKGKIPQEWESGENNTCMQGVSKNPANSFEIRYL